MKPKKIKSSDFAGLVRPAPEQTNAPRRANANPSGYGHEGNYGGGSETDNPSYGNGNPSYGSGNPSYGGDSYYGGGYKVYTVEEFYNWEGVWPGGYVEGMGYVMGEVVVYGEYTGYKEPYKEEYDTPNVPFPGFPSGYPKPDYPEQPYEEYYLVYDPYYHNKYPGGSGGSSTPSDPPASQTNGVDITKGNFNFPGLKGYKEYDVLYTQLIRILQSNSQLKKMLEY